MSLKTGVSILAVTVGVANPVWAEMDAREVWSDINGLMSFLGEVQVGQIVESETEVNLTGVVIAIEDGPEIFEFSFPQVLITETADGGVQAAFAPGIQASIGSPNGEGAASVDIIAEGLAVAFNDTTGLAFSIAADRLGAENFTLTLEGQPQDIGGSIVLSNLDAAFSDTGPLGATRIMDYRANFSAVEASGFARNIEELLEMTGALTIAGLQSSGRLDAPVGLYEGRGNLLGMLISQAQIDLEAVEMAAMFRGVEETPEDAARFDMAMGLDHFRLDHAATAPLDETLYVNGQDVVADDLEAFVDYSIGGLTMEIQSDITSGYGDFSSRDTVSMPRLEATAAGRIEVDDASNFTMASNAALTMAIEVDNGFTSGDSTYSTSLTFDILNYLNTAEVAIPLDNAMMQFMQGIPDGLIYTVSYTIESGSFGFSEEDAYQGGAPETEAASGRIEGVAASGSLTARGVESRLQADVLEGAYAGYEAPQGVDGSATGLRFATAFPLATGTELLPYSLELGVDEVVLGQTIWDMVDPGGELDQSPMALSLTAGGDTIANFSPIGFVALGTGGFNPIQPQTLAFDLLATAVGARLAGTGEFDVSQTMQNETPPVGTASFEGSGIADLMAAMGRLGLLSEGELSEGTFLLGAFTTQDDDGTRRMVVEINEEQHLIVNGQRMQ